MSLEYLQQGITSQEWEDYFYLTLLFKSCIYFWYEGMVAIESFSACYMVCLCPQPNLILNCSSHNSHVLWKWPDGR